MDSNKKKKKRIVASGEQIYLVNAEYAQIVTSKLPSNRDVLGSFFYNTRKLHINSKESADLVYTEVSVFWLKARIRLREKQHCVKKVLDLYNKWKNLKKSKDRESNIPKEKAFINELDDLFDIAHKDALDTLEGDGKEFLVNQRKHRRPGLLADVARRIEAASNQPKKRSHKKMKGSNKRRKFDYAQTHCNVSELEEDTTTHSEGDKVSNDEKIRTKGTENFIDTRLLSALDACGLSDRDAARIITATAAALGHKVSNLIVNKTTINDLRSKNRNVIHAIVTERLEVIFFYISQLSSFFH